MGRACEGGFVKQHRGGRFVRVLVVVALVAAPTLLRTGSAAANNFGSTACTGNPVTCVSLGFHPNGAQPLCIDSVGANMRTEVVWVAGYDYQDQWNHVTMWDYPECIDHGVRITDGAVGQNGFAGWVRCPTTAQQWVDNGQRRCLHQAMIINQTYVNTDTGDPNYLAALACHELGQTVGLRHSTDTGSCMRNPAVAFSWDTTGHDNTHLWNWYT